MVEDHSDHSASIGTAKSTLDQDSSVAMMCHDPSSSTRPCVKGGGEGGGGLGGSGCAYPTGVSSFCNFVLTLFFWGGGGVEALLYICYC